MLKFVTGLMEKNYEAVGFLPAPRVEAYFDAGQVLLQMENDEPCGYLIFGNGWPILKVYQCCIQTDARRRDNAADLVRRLIDIARSRACYLITLWCADDLEANAFWQAMGFHFGGHRDNGNRRGRLHNRWSLWVSGTVQPDFFGPERVQFPTAAMAE